MPPKQRPNRSKAAKGDGKRNLVLVHSHGLQERRDFEEIAALVEKQAPDIVVTIVDNQWPFPGIADKLAERPTLIFSPIILVSFDPKRGRVYFGRSLSKIQEYWALRKGHIATPYAAMLTPGFEADPALFGEYAIVKPSEGEASHGRGVQLMRTSRLRYIAPEDYPEGHPGRLYPMIAQRFIDTGPRPSHMRVLTLFGEPLYSVTHRLVDPRAPLTAPDEALETSNIATNGGERVRALSIDPDVIALAREVHAAVPGAALQGVDIIRDQDGKLWVLEFNGGGNTWHFSSDYGQDLRLAVAAAAGVTSDMSEAGRKLLVAQFDAFETAARLLAHRTLTEAL